MRQTVLAAALTLVAAPVLGDGSITVAGRGEVFAAPDKATLTLGVTTEAPEAAAAMAANAEAMSAVLARLTGLGIAERDLQTSQLSLSPLWEGPGPDGSGTPRITGFVASNLLTVEVRDLAQVGPVLDATLGEGANTLNGLVFGITDQRPLLDQARRAAVEDAAAKARVLAEAAGVTLGALEEIREGVDFDRPMPFARMEASMADGAPIAPGELGLAVTVTMSWEIGD